MKHDEIKINAVHHIEFFVGNAKQAAHFYRNVLGFSQCAYSGLETDSREKTSYVLEQGNIKLVLSSPLRSHHAISTFISTHGDGVYDIAFDVDDVDTCFELAISRGAKVAIKPYSKVDNFGQVRHAAIHIYGDVIHSFISRKDYKGVFLPGFKEDRIAGDSVGLDIIDHVVGNVEEGEMNNWVKFYEHVMGFSLLQHFSDEAISTEYTALMSKVMENNNGRIKLPINEPAKAKRRSQIDEYLEFNEGPGVQHIALQTHNIVETVSNIQNRGLTFLNVPDSYYDDLENRIGKIDENIDALRQYNILVDKDDEGYLLQLFTRPVQDRPTLFFEIIQRKGSRGFGLGNFKALFEAIEREQAERGNL